MGIFELLILNVKKYKISTDFNTGFVSADTIINASNLNGSTRIRLKDTLKYFKEVKRGAYALLVQIAPHFMERGESHRSSLQKNILVYLLMHRQC